MSAYGSQASLPNYYNDAPDRPLFGESRPRVSKTICLVSQLVNMCFILHLISSLVNTVLTTS